MKRGKLILVIGPTGVGKDTLVNLYVKENPNAEIFISATTRDPREGEVDKKDYFFLSNEEFERGIKEDRFLEYALVHNSSYYGTPKEQIKKAIEEGREILGDIDYQGFLSIKEKLPKEELISIFVFPPSLSILKKRIEERSQMSKEELKKRFESIEKELKVSDKCDGTIKTIEGDIYGSYREFKKEIERIKGSSEENC